VCGVCLCVSVCGVCLCGVYVVCVNKRLQSKGDQGKALQDSNKTLNKAITMLEDQQKTIKEKNEEIIALKNSLKDRPTGLSGLFGT